MIVPRGGDSRAPAVAQAIDDGRHADPAYEKAT